MPCSALNFSLDFSWETNGTEVESPERIAPARTRQVTSHGVQGVSASPNSVARGWAAEGNAWRTGCEASLWRWRCKRSMRTSGLS